MAVYKHEPLDYTETPSFRLLSYLRSLPGDQTKYTIFQQAMLFSLDYICLSYTWGTSGPTASIPIVSRDSSKPDKYPVGENLSNFLYAYDTHDWGRSCRPFSRLWIDQICIDQSNLEERSAQVSMMNQIYKRAKRVLVWLGCEPEMVQAARQLRDNTTDDHTLPILLQHQYFSRTWVIQEVSLTTNVYVVCGEVEFEWRVLFHAAQAWQERLSHLNPSLHIPSPALRLVFWANSYVTLWDCISTFCHHGCQDPRDKVYALLSLTSERWRIHVDYRKTVVRVYVDTIKALYEELFDRLDPNCFYEEHVSRDFRSRTYIETALVLAKAMNLPPHQVKGLPPFLKRVLETYLDTPLRNIQYTLLSSPQLSARVQEEEEEKEEEEEEKSWFSRITPQRRKSKQNSTSKQNMTATRRNPLLQDVIPSMGLRLARPRPNDTNALGSNQKSTPDQWWFRYEEELHVFDCPAGEDVGSRD